MLNIFNVCSVFMISQCFVQINISTFTCRNVPVFFYQNSAGFSFEEVCYRSSLTKVPLLTFSADLPMENPFSLIMKNEIYFSKLEC